MSEPDDGQDSVLTPAYRKPNRHNAKLCPLAIRGRIVNALAASDSQAAIARALRVSRNTISAVAEQEWSKLEQRKARIAAQSERNATRAAELIAEKLEREDVPLNVLVPRVRCQRGQIPRPSWRRVRKYVPQSRTPPRP